MTCRHRSDSARTRHMAMISDFLSVVVYLFALVEGIVGASGENNTDSQHSGSRTARGGGEIDRLNRAYGVKISRIRSVAWKR